MKNVQIVFNIQVPDHVSEQEVNSRLNQIFGSLLAQEFQWNVPGDDPDTVSFSVSERHVGHA